MGNLTSSLGTTLGTASSINSIISGAMSGNAFGQAGAALGAASLANKAGAFSSVPTASGQAVTGSGVNQSVGSALGIASGLLGVASGLEKGGVSGYGGATVGALQAGSGIANLAGNQALGSALGSAAGIAAIPLSLYNTVSNFKPGATASDALSAASTGATIGTAVLPGIGTVVGGLIGGAVGAIASEFGGTAGSKSEIQPFLNASTQFRQNDGSLSTLQNPYLALAGLFAYTPSEMSSTYGNNPIYSEFGRNGEGPFVEAMTSEINNAYKAGTITQGATASDIMNSVVNPWIQSFGKGSFSNESQQGQITGAIIQQAVQQYITGQAPTQWKAVGGDTPFAGNSLIPQYAGYTPPAASPTDATASSNQIVTLPGGQQIDLANIQSLLSGLG
jgi:hypothetical protein